MILGLILKEIMCGVNEFSLKLKILPHEMGTALIPLMVATFVLSFLKKLEKE